MSAALHLHYQLQDALPEADDAYLQHFRARVLQDALTEATAEYWEYRAQQLEDAIPPAGHYRKPVYVTDTPAEARERKEEWRTEYRGNATPEDITAAVVECANTVAACRRHARLLRESMPEPISDEVLAALEEVA
jgi:hypothetical protein